MISTEFKKAAKELSDVAFDYAGILSITEYRYPDEELIFISKANPKEGEMSVMRHLRVKYDRNGAEKLRKFAKDFSDMAASVSAIGDAMEPILAYFTYKTDVDKELKKAVAELIYISFDYLDLLNVSVYKKVRYDNADSAMAVRDIINEIPKLAAEVSAETEYPRLEKAESEESKEPEKPLFFRKRQIVPERSRARIARFCHRQNY